MKNKLAAFATGTLLMFSATQLSAAEQKPRYMYVGIGYAYIDDIIQNNNGAVISIGFEYKGENLYLGACAYYSGNDIENVYMAPEAQLGYMLNKDAVVYGLLSYNIQANDSFAGDSDGIGYGAGVKYQLFEDFGLNINYRQATMTPVLSMGDRDYKAAQVLIEYNNF